MTPARTHANEVGSPSLPQLWLDAMLRAFAELVQNVVSPFRLTRRRARVIGTHAAPAAQPERATDTLKETLAVPHDSPLTLVSYTAPSPSVSPATRAIHLPLLRRWRQERLRGIASTAEGGGGGLRALARKTEGAFGLTPTPNKNAAS